MADLTSEQFTRRVQPIVLANRGYSKIFAIGANKTGTTSLERVLRLYGFNVPNQQAQGVLIAKQTWLGNYEPLKRLVSQYDAFQDIPFSIQSTYIVADSLFPNSKFILTERDPEIWFDSLYRYHQRQTGVQDLRSMTPEDVKTRFKYLYPGFMFESFERTLLTFEEGLPKVQWDRLYERESYIDAYVRRNKEIKKYFHGRPKSLLCIDLTTEESTAKICAFLDIPAEFEIRVPHLNRTAQDG
jgi:hypothetical protein